MGLDAKGGRLVIRSVHTGSFAEDVGLFEKDVILSINRQPVATVEDVVNIQSTLKAGDAVAFSHHAAGCSRPRRRATVDYVLCLRNPASGVGR